MVRDGETSQATLEYLLSQLLWRKAVQPPRWLASRLRDTGSKATDELTDAAVLLSKDMDSNAEEHDLQEVTTGHPSCEIEGPKAFWRHWRSTL